MDDLARAISLERGATFGLHRLSFTELAARLAIMELASCDRGPTTTLGHEAVATCAAFEAQSDDALQHFSPVSQTPGFPKALARMMRPRSPISPCDIHMITTREKDRTL